MLAGAFLNEHRLIVMKGLKVSSWKPLAGR